MADDSVASWGNTDLCITIKYKVLVYPFDPAY